MSESYIICDLTELNIDDVLAIFLRELGDYQSKNNLQKCLESNSEFHCKVLINDEQIVFGFSLYMALDPKSAMLNLKLPKSTHRNKILSAKKVGILDAAAIDPDKRKIGAGFKIIHESFSELVNSGCDVICAMVCKDKHGVANAEKVVTGLGLEKVFEIPEYWGKFSGAESSYVCPNCGTPPCKCVGVLFVKYL